MAHLKVCHLINNKESINKPVEAQKLDTFLTDRNALGSVRLACRGALGIGSDPREPRDGEECGMLFQVRISALKRASRRKYGSEDGGLLF